MELKKMITMALLLASCSLLAQDSKSDKAYIETWMAAHPSVRYIPQSQYKSATPGQQQRYRALNYLICADETLTRADVDAYERAQATRKEEAVNPRKIEEFKAKRLNTVSQKPSPAKAEDPETLRKRAAKSQGK